MTSSAACAVSLASNRQPHSSGKERDTESGNDYFGGKRGGETRGRTDSLPHDRRMTKAYLKSTSSSIFLLELEPWDDWPES
jgi:hypothetical protein